VSNSPGAATGSAISKHQALAQADACERLASIEPAPARQGALLKMAQLWRNLADVSDTPSPDADAEFERLLELQRVFVGLDDSR
jgi:hypothetical protein